MSKNLTKAQEKGYTQEYFASSTESDLTILVKPNTDLDGTFTAFDVDNETWVKINGWNWMFEPVMPIDKG